MTVISDSIRSVSGVPDDRQITFACSVLRDSGGGDAIVSTRFENVTPVDGEFSVDLDPGPAEVVIRNQTFKFVVPESGPSRLWPLIEDYVPVAAPVVNAAVVAKNAAVAAADRAEAVADVQDAAIADVVVAGETKAALDASYAPVSVVAAVGTKLTQSQVDARVTAVGNATYAPTSVTTTKLDKTEAATKYGRKWSVTPEEFGAVGDGTTDDGPALQAAIDYLNNGGGGAANTVGGGTVSFGPKTYLTGQTIILYGGIHLAGAGPGGDVFSNTDANLPFRGTVLKLKASANVDLVKTANYATLHGAADQSIAQPFLTPNRFSITNMVLDGNKYANSSGDVLKIYGRSFWLDRLVIQNGAGLGLHTEFGTSAGYDNEAQLSNLRIQDNVSHGWEFIGPHDSVISNVFSSRNGGSGFITDARAGSLQVTNMHNWGNALYNFDDGSPDASYVNCVCDSAGGPGLAGIRIRNSNFRWYGGSIYGTNIAGEALVQVGDGTAGTISGIHIDTRWWNVALGSVLVRYAASATPQWNVFRGHVQNSTNGRHLAGPGVAKIAGDQTTPVTTINVADTSSMASSGSIYCKAGTLTYTGKTSTTLTGVSGGNAGVVLADNTYLFQSNTVSTLSETYDFRSSDGNSALPNQLGGSTTKVADNTTTDKIGQITIRALAYVSQTISAAGAVTFNAANGNMQHVVLRANVTSSTITNPTNGQLMKITYVQDTPAGGYTFAWPTNCKFAGGAAPTTTTYGKRLTVEFWYDSSSSNWYETSRAVDVG